MPSLSAPVVIAGHSQAKYFSQYLFHTNVDVLSFSGFQIPQMFEKIQHTIPDYKVVVLHVGANDLSNGSTVPAMLQMYQDLTGRIWEINPRAHILLSGVLPRAENRFPGATNHHQFLDVVNHKAHHLNRTLARISSTKPQLHYVGHPSFMRRGKIQRHLLSRDGLHLSWHGYEDCSSGHRGCPSSLALLSHFL